MMRLCPDESNVSELVYREPAHPFFGLPVAMVGLGIVVGSAGDALRRWPDVFGSSLGVVLGFVLTGVGATLLCSRTVIFHRAEGRIVDTRRWFLFGWTKTRALSDFQEISWSRKVRSSGGDLAFQYPVVLRGAGDDFNLIDTPNTASARELTSEIGAFLGLKQTHWDDAVLDPSSELGRIYRREQARAISRAQASGHMTPLVMEVSESGTRAVLRKKAQGRSGGFFGLFGIAACFMGGFFVLLPFTGGTFNGRKDAFWEPILVGSALAGIGAAIVLYRRETRFDKEERVATSSWGFWKFRRESTHDLSCYAGVGFSETVASGDLMAHLYLKGNGAPDLPLQRTVDLNEARALAENLARFLNLPLLDDSRASPAESRPA